MMELKMYNQQTRPSLEDITTTYERKEKIDSNTSEVLSRLDAHARPIADHISIKLTREFFLFHLSMDHQVVGMEKVQ